MEHIIDEIIANYNEDKPFISQIEKLKGELDTDQFIEEFLQKTDKETREMIRKHLL